MLQGILKISIIVAAVTFSSCKNCKQCYLEENDVDEGKKVTTSLGEKCGAELKKTDGLEYDAADGPAHSYCK